MMEAKVIRNKVMNLGKPAKVLNIKVTHPVPTFPEFGGAFLLPSFTGLWKQTEALYHRSLLSLIRANTVKFLRNSFQSTCLSVNQCRKSSFVLPQKKFASKKCHLLLSSSFSLKTCLMKNVIKSNLKFEFDI